MLHFLPGLRGPVWYTLPVCLLLRPLTCLYSFLALPSRCENCTSRFRTYRSLFKHLHVCSESASPSPSLMAEKPPVLPPTSSPEKEPPGKLLEELPQLQSVIQHLKKEALLSPSTTEAASALATESLAAPSLEAMPLPTPATHAYPLLESSLFGPPTSLARFSGPPHPSVPGPYLPYMHPSTFALPQASVQSRLRPYLPGQGLPVSNAVWKKSQGELLPRSWGSFHAPAILCCLNHSLLFLATVTCVCG